MSVLLLFVYILLIILGLIWLQKNASSKRNNKSFFKDVDGPKGLPILGNGLDFKSTEDLLPVLLKYKQQFGRIYKINIGLISRYVISDHDFLEFMMSSYKFLEKSKDYKFLLPWLGTGLLISKGQKWKTHRKIITPTFHFKILERFVNTFESSTKIMISKLKAIEDKRSVNVFPFISLCALDIICETAMGFKINAQIDEKSEYVQSVKNLCRIMATRSISILKQLDFTYQFTDDYKIEQKALKHLHGVTYAVINSRREELKNQTPESNKESNKKNKTAFLDLLLQTTCDGEPFTDEELREEVDTFIFEGHDTTSAAISFAIYALAQNPEVQKRVYEEQMELFHHNKDPKVSYNDLQNMQYLERVIKETLRLYPSVPVVARQAGEDIEYEGKIIPKNTIITIFIYGIMRDPGYFPDPDKFDPDRFLERDGTLPFAYIPFSAGPRNCIGQKFAMLEMKNTISTIVRNFELLPTNGPELRLSSETILFSKNGVHVELKERS